MNLFDVVLLLLILFFAYLFWQWRRQDEHARKYADIYCQQNKLQLLDVARVKGRPAYRRGLAWQADFQFDFSGDRESRYTGTLTMLNLRLKNVHVPPHRVCMVRCRRPYAMATIQT